MQQAIDCTSDLQCLSALQYLAHSQRVVPKTLMMPLHHHCMWHDKRDCYNLQSCSSVITCPLNVSSWRQIDRVVYLVSPCHAANNLLCLYVLRMYPFFVHMTIMKPCPCNRSRRHYISPPNYGQLQAQSLHDCGSDCFGNCLHRQPWPCPRQQ